MARPRKHNFTDSQIKWVEEHIKFTTIKDIAAYLGIPHETCRVRFGELFQKAQAEKRIALRKLQWKAAENLNPTMLIWLGKQDLDQTDDGIINRDDLIGEVNFGEIK